KATERLRDGRCWGAIIDNALNGHGCGHRRRTTIAHSITPTALTAPTAPAPDNTEPQEETKYLHHQCLPRGHCRYPHPVPVRSPHGQPRGCQSYFFMLTGP